MKTLFDRTQSQESLSEVNTHEFYEAMRIKTMPIFALLGNKKVFRVCLSGLTKVLNLVTFFPSHSALGYLLGCNEKSPVDK